MKSIINYLLIFSFIILLYSCATKSNVFDGSKYYLTKQDKNILLDSFQVIIVIDNRIKKDSIIGEVDYKHRPLVINRPLNDYIKMSLNSLICKDTSQPVIIPITVYIDEFYSGRYATYNNNFLYSKQYVYNKYSYLFEYTYNNKLNKFRVLDSAVLYGDHPIGNQRQLIKNGIRNAARCFLINHYSNYPTDSIYAQKSNPEEERKDIDTIDLFKYFKLDERYEVMIGFYKGFKIDNGFQASYYNFFSKPQVKIEFGLGFAIQSSKITNGKKSGKSLDISMPFIFRYNFTEQKNKFYAEFSTSISAETEKIRNNYSGVFFGTRFKESIGYKIGRQFTISFGLYQEGHFKAKLLPYDFGLALSLGLNSIYK